MNKQMIFRTAAASLVAIAVAIAAPWNQPLNAQQGHRGGEGHGKQMEKIMGKLNLTEQQKAQIKTLRENFKKEHEAELTQIKSLRGQMKDLKGSGDKAKATELRSQIKTQMATLKEAREKLKQQIVAILTPEQQQQLEQLKAERKEHRKEMKEGRMGRKHNGVTGEGKKLE